MKAGELESDETPRDRVTALRDVECRDCLEAIVASIIKEKSAAYVPDVLHEFRLLAAFEVYDADLEAQP